MYTYMYVCMYVHKELYALILVIYVHNFRIYINLLQYMESKILSFVLVNNVFEFIYACMYVFICLQTYALIYIHICMRVKCM